MPRSAPTLILYQMGTSLILILSVTDIKKQPYLKAEARNTNYKPNKHLSPKYDKIVLTPAAYIRIRHFCSSNLRLKPDCTEWGF